MAGSAIPKLTSSQRMIAAAGSYSSNKGQTAGRPGGLV